METITLPHLPNTPIQVCLFNHVQNSTFLRQQLLEGNKDFEYAFLDASVLISTSQVLAACFKAISDSLNGRLKTRNVHSEIVFALSPNNNVSFLQSSYSEHSTNSQSIDRRVFPPLRHPRHQHLCRCHQSLEQPRPVIHRAPA
jgi:EKC/KEOPS complex subunit CGI121/TPRKB